MSDNTITIRNHALLFAFIATEAAEYPSSKQALLKAVTHYGMQRGQRMAQRARKDGMPITVGNYLLYGEWVATPGEVDLRTPRFSPEVQLENRLCPWYAEWDKAGMLAAGKLYCSVVDAAIAKGFDADLNMELVQGRMQGDAYCDFFFRDRSMDENEVAKYQRNRERLGGQAKMNWSYHTAHLFYSVLEVLQQMLGEEARQKIEQAALLEYKKTFGSNAAKALIAYAKENFNLATTYQGTEGLEP